MFIFRSVIGGKDGESKTDRKVWNVTNQKAREFPIPNEIVLSGRINIYSIIREYLEIRLKIQTSTNQFSLGLKTTVKDLCGGDTKKYFMKQPLGRHSFTKIVSNFCSKLGLRGDGAHEIVTTHGLRATMVTLLIDAGYHDATITLRTGHHDVKSLRNYHTLRGIIGANQIRRMFGDGLLSDCNGRYQFKNGL